MNDIQLTNMLFTFSPNSSFFTSLPFTIGHKCGELIKLNSGYAMFGAISE